MAILGRNILKSFFKNGDKPNENNFWDWMDSFFHKTEDKLPITSVTDLAETLNSKANNTALQSETTQRIESDTNLQKQIESLLESISGVTSLTAIRGVVRNRWELENIDTTNFQNGDLYICAEDYGTPIEFWIFDKDKDEWEEFFVIKGKPSVRSIVKTYRDLDSLRPMLSHEDICIVISDETKSYHTTCYRWEGDWEFIHEWIPQGGSGTGGDGFNLANADLAQTDPNRMYFLNGGTLVFDNAKGRLSSQFEIGNGNVNLNFNDNGSYGNVGFHTAGLDIDLPTQNTFCHIGPDQFYFENNISNFRMGSGDFSLLYNDSVYERGMNVQNGNLHIISKMNQMPSEIVMDGFVRISHMNEIDEHEIHNFPDASILFSDGSGYLQKMSIKTLTEMLRTYLS
ncbi:MAG: hypothetical protein LIO93_08530, partial [Bacteroidales bacterium]|nr:hypothetical protein [Bacteroidales bacterium]